MKYKAEFQDSIGNTLRGVFSTVKGDKDLPIVILVHGFTVSKDTSPMPEYEDILNKKNISTFRFDLFGHGDSDGLFEDNTISKGVDCVLSAIDFVSSLGFSSIGLLGESFGGQCSLIAASRTDKLSCLCLKSPVVDYAEVERLRRSPETMKSWKETGMIEFVNGLDRKKRLKFSFSQDISNHDGYESAKDVSIPVFVAHGDKDDIVPFKQSEKLSEILSHREFHLYPNIKHHFLDKKLFARLLKESSDFFVNSFKK